MVDIPISEKAKDSMERIYNGGVKASNPKSILVVNVKTGEISAIRPRTRAARRFQKSLELQDGEWD